MELGCPIDGMLGMEFYKRFCVETDGDCFRLHRSENTERLCKAKGMTPLTLAVLPSQLLGVEVDVHGGRRRNVDG
eukprot:CAMPEP_0117612198 /NCGR_PEP_ID=MMETSP0784-20121206/82821_1 /TAXON_ID=39447 /ORGANISM="" /LENGTH=74 /DNA_ID=CAMNT_0005415737 /DNA_START=60 /DNA_END=281 /DNA_ORIENTATION=+